MEQVIAEQSELNKKVDVIIGIMKKTAKQVCKSTWNCRDGNYSNEFTQCYWFSKTLARILGGLHVFPVNREYIVVDCWNFPFYDRPNTQKASIVADEFTQNPTTGLPFHQSCQ